MFQFFANIFGYVLNFIYQFVNNYGIAMILFTILIKLLMLPFTIKQQKTMKKNVKIQEKIKVLQFKYKNDQEKMSQELMRLYKEEKISPFSGCFTAIIQFILLISIFYMVRCPLTYMKKIDTNVIDNHIQQLREAGKTTSAAYPEIDIIREIAFLQEKNPDDQNIEQYKINMDFLGLDLSKVPQQNLGDWTVYIIPILYILSTFVSMKLVSNMQGKNKKKEAVIDVTEKNDKEKSLVASEEEEIDPMEQTNKMMSWMMPIMSVSISLVAPLGLALYWLVNNITMIIERIVLNIALKEKED